KERKITMLYQQDVSRALPGLENDKKAADAWKALLVKTGTAMQRLQEKYGPNGVPLYGVGKNATDLKSIVALGKEIRARFNTVVLIGTGGSSLGAKALAALAEDRTDTKVTLHLLENVDPDTTETLLRRLDPQNTLFLLVSKSGGTVETLGEGLVAL